MINARGILPLTVVSAMLLTACGHSSGSSDSAAPPGVKPDLTVTLDGKRHKCIVALSSEAQGSFIPCTEVVPFVRDELRLPKGSRYDIRTVPTVDDTEVAKVRDSLSGAGYRFIGVSGDR